MQIPEAQAAQLDSLDSEWARFQVRDGRCWEREGCSGSYVSWVTQRNDTFTHARGHTKEDATISQWRLAPFNPTLVNRLDFMTQAAAWKRPRTFSGTRFAVLACFE